MRKIDFLFVSILAIALVGCNAYSANNESTEIAPADNKTFSAYWYQGKAELSRYELEQVRYGEIHNGNAVMVFVTEDFRTDLQVKLESGARDKATPILKLNLLKKFPTGIYDYSMMTSVFQPLDQEAYPHALKVSTSSQEWCGQTFTQLNLRDDNYVLSGYSYFESEGDQDIQLSATWLEDEFWTMIRTAPENLPEGELKVIPGTQFSRLKHVPFRVETAQCSVSDFKDSGYPGEKLKVFKVNYPTLKRELSIVFESEFPHRIAGWEDRHSSGWGAGAKMLTTKAVRTHEIMEPYWSQNSNSDSGKRKELGL